MLRSTIFCALLLVASANALAGPGDNAQIHFKAIASGDPAQIMPGYADSVTLQWLGGPLDGSYTGVEKVQEVWGKFAKANGPLELRVAKLEESANPKGATVTANVEFKGKNTIKVRYVLVYRDGQLVNEVWQIDPNLAIPY